MRNVAMAALVVVLWAGFGGPLHGQESQALSAPPPLSRVFPLEVRPDGVGLRVPVLLNGETVLGTSAVLHSIYVDQSGDLHVRGGDSDSPAPSGGRHHRHGGDTPPPAPSDVGGSGAVATPEAAKGKTPTEVWTSLDPFREALDAPEQYDKIVVYTLPGDAKPRKATIDLPDGMLLTEGDGRVRVLWLTATAKAAQNGVRPDDEIRSFQGPQGPVPVTSLADFLKAYIGAKKESRNSGKAYVMEVWRPGEGKSITLSFPAPPSLSVPFF